MRLLAILVLVFSGVALGVPRAADNIDDLINKWGAELTADQIADILNNFGHETVECIAYYRITKEALQKTSPEYARLQRHTEKIIKLLITRALMLQDADVVRARLKLSTNEMIAHMRGRWERFSILLNKYANLCKESAENPLKRLRYWRTKLYGG